MKQNLLPAHSNLIKDLLYIAQKKVKKRGRRLSWLSYAESPALSGAFFVKKLEKVNDEIWDTWHEIVKEVHTIHPQYEFAFIAELASELFNMRENYLLALEGSL